MNLLQTFELLADIGDDAIRILHKRVGKTKGLDSIEDQIRSIATDAAEDSFGEDLDPVAIKHIDRYVQKRMGYMKNAFKKLNSPKTDTSKARGEFTGETEKRSAKQFGTTKGYERLSKTSKKKIFKEWNATDSCPECSANEEQGPIPVGARFQSGDYSPQAHPKCDCTLTFTDASGNEV